MTDRDNGSPNSNDIDGDEGQGYARYVLFVLVLVYVFNFIDRQILSILAEEIKADLDLSDASLGFLYGTAFAVFYAVFGIPISRLSDMWIRKKVIAIGLFFWSVMTALSGTARGFGSLAVFRFGVGIGESCASPAAISMLGDYFSPRVRATVLAIYSSGVYIGAGVGIFLGGFIVDTWNGWYPPGTAPYGIAGWQAAFFAVGAPGILMAFWVSTIREPVRGATEGLVSTQVQERPFYKFAAELASILPPFSLFALRKSGAKNRDILINVAIAAFTVLIASLLVALLGSPAQWIGLGIGVYAFLTWIQSLSLRDPVTFDFIYRSRAVVYGMLGFGWHCFVTYGLLFFTAPFLIRVHGVSATEVGLYSGLLGAVAGLIGITAGGIISDRLKRRIPKARPYIGIAVAITTIPLAIVYLTIDNIVLVYVFIFLFTMVSSAWLGSCLALANELVLPRMRAAASAFYILCVTFVGLALGPYSIGRTSDWLATQTTSAQGLQIAMLLSLSAEILACLFLWLSSRHVVTEEASRLDRARAAGEIA